MDESSWGVFKLCSQGSHGIESGCCQERTHNSIAFFPGQSTSTDGICSSAFSTEDAILIGQWTHILVTVKKSGSYVHMYIDNSFNNYQMRQVPLQTQLTLGLSSGLVVRMQQQGMDSSSVRCQAVGAHA